MEENTSGYLLCTLGLKSSGQWYTREDSSTEAWRGEVASTPATKNSPCVFRGNNTMVLWSFMHLNIQNIWQLRAQRNGELPGWRRDASLRTEEDALKFEKSQTSCGKDTTRTNKIADDDDTWGTWPAWFCGSYGRCGARWCGPPARPSQGRGRQVEGTSGTLCPTREDWHTGSPRTLLWTGSSGAWPEPAWTRRSRAWRPDPPAWRVLKWHEKGERLDVTWVLDNTD